MIYLHVMKRPGMGAPSPLDFDQGGVLQAQFAPTSEQYFDLICGGVYDLPPPPG